MHVGNAAAEKPPQLRGQQLLGARHTVCHKGNKHESRPLHLYSIVKQSLYVYSLDYITQHKSFSGKKTYEEERDG